MTSIVDNVRECLASEKCLVCVCSDDALSLALSLNESDPVPQASGRPVFYWDAVDGFNDLSGGGNAPESLEEVFKALDHAARYTGSAIFVFNFDDVPVRDEEKAHRRKIKSMAGRFTAHRKRVLVITSKTPLPDSIARLCHRISYPAEPLRPSDDQAHVRPAEQSLWREIRNLETFSSHEWTERLDRITDQEINQIIAGGFHNESAQRIQDLRATLRRQFARKEDLIDLMAYASVAQVPMVLLGPPGTAKSNMVRNFCEGLGLAESRPASSVGDGHAAEDSVGNGNGGLFEYLLTRYTTPEEIFGPIHIGDLINKQKYYRVTTDRLPEAEVAFLDEIFKASSAIVNTLLTILNERVFHNGGRVQKVPLIMVFAASNEPPQDPGLAALYDRFPIRASCSRIGDEHVNELWQRSWELGYDKRFDPQHVSIDQLACTNDLRLLHRVAWCHYGGRALESGGRVGSFDFNAEFLRVFRSLRRDFDISDRTLAALYALARAMAVVEGRNHLSSEELNVFRYVSWDESGTGELEQLVANLKRGVSV